MNDPILTSILDVLVHCADLKCGWIGPVRDAEPHRNEEDLACPLCGAYAFEVQH